jgi:hypothetical protein
MPSCAIHFSKSSIPTLDPGVDPVDPWMTNAPDGKMLSFSSYCWSSGSSSIVFVVVAIFVKKDFPVATDWSIWKTRDLFTKPKSTTMATVPLNGAKALPLNGAESLRALELLHPESGNLVAWARGFSPPLSQREEQKVETPVAAVHTAGMNLLSVRFNNGCATIPPNATASVLQRKRRRRYNRKHLARNCQFSSHTLLPPPG